MCFTLFKANCDDVAESSFFQYQFDPVDNDISKSCYDCNYSIFIFGCPQKSTSSVNQESIKREVQSFHSGLSDLNLNQKQTNKVYALVENLIRKSAEFCVSSINENILDSPSHVVDQAIDLVMNRLSERNTEYKRNKEIESNEFYVAPKEMAIGLRWERAKVRRNGRIQSIPRLIQCTFQYVSIVDTLKSLFRSNEFSDAYFKHNLEVDHDCTDDASYHDFCCGESFKQNIFFKNNPNCVKIQLYADEFELCNPLQSKSGVHKVCAIYFTIRNMPKQFSCKVNNIFLVKQMILKQTDFNNIWRPIVNDLRYLESYEIDTMEGTIKAVLTHLSFDNLGANSGLGFASSFSALYYCRFCMLSKAECQKTTRDDIMQRRTMSDYEKQVKVVENSEKVSYSETKGVKYYCVLNDLHNFHVIKNPTVDVLHDHNEGSIPHLLKLFIDRCFSFKTFSLEQLRDLVQFHDYGLLNRKNIPSQIKLDLRSIGQNGTQSICLFRNIPFILYQFKDDPKLQPLWKCMQYLLQILVIVYSHVISEENLQNLEKLIHLFLSSILACFDENLIPKLHFLLHYPSIIRMVGPVVFMSTIRYEAKHQVFKNMIQNTKNFRNINKSLALKHQRNICVQGVSLKDEIKSTKLKSTHDEIFTHGDSTSPLEKLMETDSLSFNSYEYRNGFLFIHESKLYQIQKIYCVGDKYIFSCKQYQVLSFDNFLNSFQVEKANGSDIILINFIDVKNKISYETKKWLMF